MNAISNKKIAFLGTGDIGRPMASSILKAGFKLHVWNRTKEKALPLMTEGAVVKDKAAEAADGADIIITVLTDGKSVGDVYFSHGVAEASAENALYIDMSTIGPEAALEHAKRLKELGKRYIDAPVSGGTVGAAAGTLAIMAGGEEEDISEVKELFSAMGNVTHMGPNGMGQLTKLCNQIIGFGTISAVAEALYLAETFGLNQDKLIEALRGGFADSNALKHSGKRISNRDWKPGFRSKVALKDCKLLEELLESKKIDLPMTKLVSKEIDELVNQLQGGDLDLAAMYLDIVNKQ